MNKTKNVISLCINAVIIATLIIGLCVAIPDSQKQGVSYGLLFIYFTTLSNIFLMVASSIITVYQSLFLSSKIKTIPQWVNVVKLCATTSTTITMLVVIFFLTPMFAMNKDPEAMSVSFLYEGSNFIFHVLNPILGIVSFLLFENNKKIFFPKISYSLIFTGLYEIFYTTDIFLEWIPVQGQTKHDWYGFLTLVNGNKNLVPIILLIFLGITFLIAWLLWLGNRKIIILENKKVATK